MDWLVLAEKVAVPATTAVGAFVGAALRFKARIDKLEKDFGVLVSLFEDTKKGWKFELTDFKEEMYEELGKLRNQLDKYESELDRFRDSSVDFAKDAELATFVTEQQKQWQAIQRTLGKIEGMIERQGWK